MNAPMTIKKATMDALEDIVTLALLLWPEHSFDPLAEEFSATVADRQAVVYLTYLGQQAVGFAQGQLRFDYVEGTSTQPVGYLEGIYVRPEFRHRGIATHLLAAVEDWAREQGCTEFASDTPQSQQDSISFHLQQGFVRQEPIVFFTKKL